MFFSGDKPELVPNLRRRFLSCGVSFLATTYPFKMEHDYGIMQSFVCELLLLNNRLISLVEVTVTTSEISSAMNGAKSRNGSAFVTSQAQKLNF